MRFTSRTVDRGIEVVVVFVLGLTVAGILLWMGHTAACGVGFPGGP